MIEAWHWGVLSALLIAAEILAPGFVLLWFGLGAGAAALALLAAPDLPVWAQALVFAVSSLASLIVWKSCERKRADHGENATLNQWTKQMEGKTGVVCETISNGQGAVLVNGVRWSADGPDLLKGAPIRVVKARSTRVTVEPIPADEA